MPVTAKLSSKFYEAFGDEIANTLVEWFNQVDATYRADLLQLNELNFDRFDAKLEQRMTQLDAKWSSIWQELDAKFEKRTAQLEARLENSLAQLGAKSKQQIAEIRADFRQEIARLESKLEQHLAALRSELTHGIAELRGELRAEFHTKLAALETKIIRWMFVFWVGTLVPLAGLILALML